MSRTLLLRDPDCSWRDWLKENRKGRDYICLNPADPDQGPPGRLCLFREDKVVAWRFYGSIDPQRSPHVLIAALAHLLAGASESVIVELWPNRGTPVIRQATMLAAQLFQPDEILIPLGSRIDQSGFPVGPEEIQIEPAFPEMVQNAQRKAHWLRMFENCESHEFELSRVSVEGARLGSGMNLTQTQLQPYFGDQVLHAEAAGNSLFLVAKEDPEDLAVVRALDHFNCSRAHIAHPAEYEGLLCSFAKANGEDFGIGCIESIDFGEGIVNAHCTAVAPAPVRILRLGNLRVNTAGTELGETRPWQV
jgi:polynucleotide 5'-kinase involved in rRNA processing